MDENANKATLALMGFLSGVHKSIWDLRKRELTEDEERHLDSAQVFIEAAFEKLQKVIGE